MSTFPHDPPPDSLHPAGYQAPPPDDFDPAGEELAGALRKSFRVLKVLMFVLIALFFLSGFFSVKPNEQGVVLRFGRIVGVGSADAVKGPGWHWSLPFPIDQWQTVAVSEREMELEFMLELTPEERATGKIQEKFANLFPERDDYLVTGDVNILHAKLLVKYRIENIVDYITHVLPMPHPRADVRDPAFMHVPEYTILRSLARDAVIETAAGFGALDIRGSRQDEFLLAIAQCLNKRLKHLADGGASLGLHVDENSGVIAPKSKTGQLEAIMPPRQTQGVFDQVFSAQTNKVVTITKAHSEAESMLVNTVGPDYSALAAAIDEEYRLLLQLSKAESAASDAGGAPVAPDLRVKLAAQRETVESLLRSASGEIRSIIKDAELERDSVIKEASGDLNRFNSVLPEYRRNPAIFLARLVDEARGRALADDDVVKVYVPENAKQYRLQIPRAGGSVRTDDEKRREMEKRMKKNVGTVPVAPGIRVR